MFKAAIFDWDGVVMDSSVAHRKAWDLLAEEQNTRMEPGAFEKSFGRKNQYIIPNILGWSQDPETIEQLGDRKEALYREVLTSTGLTPLPGAIELFKTLQSAGIPMAVGTSTPRKNVETVIDIIGANGFFDAIVAAEDVTHGKPDPEVFLNGAKALGISPHDAVVFEDAVYGIQAAIAGNMKAVALTTTHPLSHFDGTTPDQVVKNLSEVTLEMLQGLWG